MELLNELITNDNKNLIIKELNDNKFEIFILLNQIKDDIHEIKNEIKDLKEQNTKFISIFLFILSGLVFKMYLFK
jgi:hypothetical protein